MRSGSLGVAAPGGGSTTVGEREGVHEMASATAKLLAMALTPPMPVPMPMPNELGRTLRAYPTAAQPLLKQTFNTEEVVE